ncbi:MAG: ATP-binding cassette domain-containing protein [Desulfarculaceae bacterium]
MARTILEVKDVKKHFPVAKGLIFLKQTGLIKAVDGVSFSIGKGETFGLVGESGCGKSTTAKLVLMQERPTSGSIYFNGQNIINLGDPELKRHRGLVQAVFQDPYSSLNPRMLVGDILAEPMIVGEEHFSNNQIKNRIAELIDLVGLRKDAAKLYPHEFSGGQRQRIAIARSLVNNPDLIILDEPVSALDVSIRAQIMNLLRDIQKKLQVSYLLIAHDFGVVKHMSNWIGVMYLGKLVEIAQSEELYFHPVHPYTQALLSAALPSHPKTQKKEIILTGEVPTPLNPPQGCRFHPRCNDVKDICSQKEPEMKMLNDGHQVACHFDY